MKGVIYVGGVIGLGLMGGRSGTVELIGVAALTTAVLGATDYILLSSSNSKGFTSSERTYMM